MGAEMFVPRREDQSDESIGAFMTRRFGAEASTYLAEPLLAGIHAGDVDRLSVRALFPRFVDAERTHGSLLRAFRAQPRSEVSVNGAFRSLPGGLSEMVRALVSVLPAAAVRLNTAVARISRASARPGFSERSAGFRIETTSGELLDADAVVVASPAYATARIVSSLDSELARLCSEIPYASTATVVLGFARTAVAHPLNGSGFVIPKVEHTGIMAASWLSSKWPHRASDDRVLLRAFVGGSRDPRALEHSDSELVQVAMKALAPLLGISGAPILTRVYRWERASAQHEVGHLTRMAAIEAALAKHQGLFVSGSGFRGVGIPDCIADGRATAKQVAAWLASERPELKLTRSVS
jgi:oxygen-dependent protoporphyrinogen oxidase